MLYIKCEGLLIALVAVPASIPNIEYIDNIRLYRWCSSSSSRTIWRHSKWRRRQRRHKQDVYGKHFTTALWSFSIKLDKGRLSCSACGKNGSRNTHPCTFISAERAWHPFSPRICGTSVSLCICFWGKLYAVQKEFMRMFILAGQLLLHCTVNMRINLKTL